MLSVIILGTARDAVASLLHQYHRQAPIELLTTQSCETIPDGMRIVRLASLEPTPQLTDGLQKARGRWIWVLRSEDQLSEDALEQVLALVLHTSSTAIWLLPLQPAMRTVLPPVQLLFTSTERSIALPSTESTAGALWALALSIGAAPRVAPRPVGTSPRIGAVERRRERRDAIRLQTRYPLSRRIWTACASRAEAALPVPQRLTAMLLRHAERLVLELQMACTRRRMPEWFPVVGAAFAGLLVAWIGIHVRLGAFALGALVAGTMTVAWFPRASLIGIYVLLLFDGALRKWILRSGQQLVYFGKDALLLLLYVRHLVTGVAEKLPPPRPLPAFVRIPLLLFAAWLVLEFLNPNQPSLTFWAFGLRVYLLPLALISVLPSLLTKDQIDRLVTGFVLASIPIGLVAALQSAMGPDHWLNQYVWGDMDVARFGGRREGLVRATATFSYITGYTSYLTTAAMLAPFAAYRLAPGRVLPLGLLYGWLLVCAILSGSRGPVLIIALGTPLIALPQFVRMGAAQIVRAWLTVAAAVIAFGLFFREPVEHFRHRVEQTADVSARLERLVRGPVEAARTGGIFGQGLATEHQSRDVLLRYSRTWKPLPPFVEEELSRVTIEMGVIGAILAWWFRIACALMCFLWLREAITSREPRDQLLLAAAMMLTIWTLATSLFYDVTMYYGWATLLALARTTGPREGDLS